MTIDLEIESLAAGGDGVGRTDAGAVFMRGGLPGDVWRGEIEVSSRRVRRLVGAERLSDGPGRRPARCPHRPACGGCDWHELSPQAALEAKGQIVTESLARIAGYDGSVVPDLAATAAGGRHRVGFKVTRAGLALMERGRHQPVTIQQCGALAPALEVAMLEFGRRLDALPPGLEGLQASLDGRGQRVVARLSVAPELTPNAARWLCQAVVRETPLDGAWVAMGQQLIEAGSCHLGGLIATGYSKRFQVRGGCFHQASPAINEALVGAVLAAAAPARRCRIVDMHGGAGNFGLVLAARGADVTIAETDVVAGRDLEANVARFKGRGQVHAALMSGEQALLRCARRGPVHAVVFDPPRSGDTDGARCIAEQRPQRVVALGCDPVAFARDLATMGLGSGYRLRKLTVWDAFPGTHHSESLALLERQG